LNVDKKMNRLRFFTAIIMICVKSVIYAQELRAGDTTVLWNQFVNSYAAFHRYGHLRVFVDNEHSGNYQNLTNSNCYIIYTWNYCANNHWQVPKNGFDLCW